MKIVLLLLLSIFIISCEEDESLDDNLAKSPLTCDNSSKSFSGCCSSHEGITNGMPNCLDGEILFDADNRVVCNDLKFRSSCTK